MRIAGFAGVVMMLRPTLDQNQLFAGLVGLLSGMGAAMAYMQVTALATPLKSPFSPIGNCTLIRRVSENSSTVVSALAKLKSDWYSAWTR